MINNTDVTTNQPKVERYPYVGTAGLVLASLPVGIVFLTVFLLLCNGVAPGCFGRGDVLLLAFFCSAFACMFISPSAILVCIIGLFVGRRDRKRSMVGLALPFFLFSFVVLSTFGALAEESDKIVVVSLGILSLLAGIAFVWGACRK
jgi:hypothetical protein